MPSCRLGLLERPMTEPGAVATALNKPKLRGSDQGEGYKLPIGSESGTSVHVGAVATAPGSVIFDARPYLLASVECGRYRSRFCYRAAELIDES